MKTRITELFGIKYPILLSGMSWISVPRMVAAVSNAGGLGILIYLILYIVLPEAKTTAQKIEMKGDPVNIHNIKEAVKSEFNTVRKNMKL